MTSRVGLSLEGKEAACQKPLAVFYNPIAPLCSGVAWMGALRCCSPAVKASSALAGAAQWIEPGPANWACKPNGYQFNSQSVHMPGLWARSPVGDT